MLGHIVFDMGDQGFDIGIHPFSRVNKLMLFDFSFQRQKFPPSNSRCSVFKFSSFSLSDKNSRSLQVNLNSSFCLFCFKTLSFGSNYSTALVSLYG